MHADEICITVFSNTFYTQCDYRMNHFCKLIVQSWFAFCDFGLNLLLIAAILARADTIYWTCDWLDTCMKHAQGMHSAVHARSTLGKFLMHCMCICCRQLAIVTMTQNSDLPTPWDEPQSPEMTPAHAECVEWDIKLYSITAKGYNAEYRCGMHKIQETEPYFYKTAL